MEKNNKQNPQSKFREVMKAIKSNTRNKSKDNSRKKKKW